MPEWEDGGKSCRAVRIVCSKSCVEVSEGVYGLGQSEDRRITYAASRGQLEVGIRSHVSFCVFDDYRLGAIFEGLGERAAVNEVGCTASQFVE